MYFDQYYVLIVRGFGRKYQSFSLSYELNGLGEITSIIDYLLYFTTII